ncbi:MAG: hypothetical protein Q9M26_04255, partial [Mariprofundales bacterium]|nr:hypothetical protein [Mariprofundales bacterium]
MLGSASGFVHSEIMPVHRTCFESLDLARLENYLRDILKDPEVPETREAWISRLKALGLMVDGVTKEPVCTIADCNYSVPYPKVVVTAQLTSDFPDSKAKKRSLLL